MSHTKSDAELEAIYKTGHGASHAHALREVYQAGRADEYAALKGTAAKPAAGETPPLKGAKRPIKGAPAPGTSQPGAATPASAGGADESAADPTDPPAGAGDPDSTPQGAGVQSAAGEETPPPAV